jgi:hypothetical protein
MKKMNIKISSSLLIMLIVLLSGCYKVQKDYKFVPYELDPHVNMTAKDYILSRSDSVTPGRIDTTFRWMKKAIEYSGIDWAEYEKPNRTYILLHNSAIRVLTSGKTTAGFFFDYPVVVKDINGNPVPSVLNPGLDSTKPALNWTEYSPTTVKNYLLSLIIEGQYNFDNLGVTNTTVKTLLPPNTVAGNDSRLAFVVVQTTPNPDPTAAGNITLNKASGRGFDPEGLMNLKIVNNQNSPIRVNDRTDDRTAGYIATNGPMHVYDKTVHPFRYSY